MEGGALQAFFSHNHVFVYFIYGLAFFLMGFSVAFYVRRPSTFRLGRYLWLLAGFGLLHGVAEWVYFFSPHCIDPGNLDTFTGTVLSASHAALIALSFTFLFSFGISLVATTLGWRKWLLWVPVAVMALWAFAFIFNQDGRLTQEWLAMAEIFSRYAMALPGAAMTSIGLYLQRSEIRALHYPPLERALLGASASFAIYALAGGLLVPPAGFFPANIINASVALNIGVPVQILRAMAGIFMAYFVIRGLDLYEIENRNRLAALRQREQIWLERERIRRDLHDGVIQSIYGLSLGLNHALGILKKDPPSCRAKLEDLSTRANSIIAGLRSYLQEMKFSAGLPDKVLLIVEDLLADFTATTGLVPDFRCRGAQEGKMEDMQREHFYHMTAEILSNIKRHSGAKNVEVDMDLGSKGLRLTIRDNGAGFLPQKVFPLGMGLTILRERAALAGGLVDIESKPGRGTEITIWLPYRLPEGEGDI